MESVLEELDLFYEVSDEQKKFFSEKGFIILKDVLSSTFLDYFIPEFTKKVVELNDLTKPMEERTTYEKAFLQVINLWTHSEIIKSFVMGKRLGSIAKQLLQVEGVRLYHDQALYKEPSSGITPWHADQFYWPLSNDRCCTAWIPLQDTPLNMGPLAFAEGSHLLDLGRNMEIGDDSEDLISKAVSENNLADISEPYQKGDVSFHLGWTFHHAGANASEDIPRKVMTIIYMDSEMRLEEPKHSFQKEDRRVFCPGIEVGEIINSPMNPFIC